MRVAAVASLLVATLLASGCVGEPKASEHEGPEPSPAVAPEPDPNATVEAPEAPRRTPLLMNWTLNETMASLGLEIAFEVPPGSECNATIGATMAPQSAGPVRIYWIETEAGTAGWGSLSFGHTAQAHVAGVVDTRDEMSASGARAQSEMRLQLQEGNVTLGLLVRDVTPLEDFPFEYRWYEGEGKPALYFQTKCDEPVDVIRSFSAGREVLMASADSMDGGAGASVFLVGSAAVDDRAGQRFDAPRVLAKVGSFGYQAGAFELSHPDGIEEWTFAASSPPTYSHEGGPGEYVGTLTRVGAYFDAFWFAAVGLHKIATPDEIVSLPPSTG
jgi:hypothetical protein